MYPASAAALTAYLSVGHQSFSIEAFDGFESINTPFSFTLHIHANQLSDAASILGKSTKLILNYSEQPNTPYHWPTSRTIYGIITKHRLNQSQQASQSKIELIFEPKLSLLHLSGEPRVFTNKTAREVVQTILKLHGYGQHQLRFDDSWPSQPQPYPYWVQAENEMDFEFVHRVLAREGISYCWTYNPNDDEEQMYFYDTTYLLPHHESAFVLSEEDGLARPNIGSLYQLNITEKPCSSTVIYHDIDTNNPKRPMVAKYGDGKMTTHVWGYGATSREQLQKATQHHHERIAMHQTTFSAITHNPSVTPGHAFSIMKVPKWLGFGQFQLSKVTHTFNKSFYHNNLEFLPKTTPVRPVVPKRLALNTIHTATIYSEHEGAYLDANGQYTFHTHAHNPEGDKEHLQKASRLTPYIGDAVKQPVGIHYPLRRQAEVLVMYLHNDFNQPILQNSPANGLNHASVNRDNSWLTQIKTAWGQYLEFCDEVGKNAITLSNASGRNHLILKRHCDEPPIFIMSCERGPISFTAEDQATIESEDELEIDVNQNLMIQSEAGLDIQAEDIHIQAEQLNIKAREQLHIKAQENIGILGEELVLNSAGGLNIEATGGAHHIELPNGDMIIEVDDLTIEAQNDMYITSRDAGIHIHPAGITMHGHTIQFNGSVQSSCPITETSVPVPPMTPPLIPKVGTLPAVRQFPFKVAKEVNPPNWDHPFHTLNDRATIEVSIKGFEGHEPGTVTIVRHHHDETQSKLPLNPLLPLLDEPEEVYNETFSLGDASLYPDKQQHERTPGTATLHIPFNINSLKGDAFPDPYYARIEVGDIKGQHYSNALLVFSSIQLAFVHDKARSYDDNHSIISLNRGLTSYATYHPQCPNARELRYDKQPTHIEHLPAGSRNSTQLKENGVYQELLKEDYTFPLHKQYIDVSNQPNKKVSMPRLMPPIIFNLRDAKLKDGEVELDTSVPNTRLELSDDEISYIKANGNNITVFIHGYNIGYGAFDEHFENMHQEQYTTIKQVGTTPIRMQDSRLVVDRTGIKASTYRDPKFLSKQFPDFTEKMIADERGYAPEDINGSGLHEWVINLEYNLNRAAGWDKKDSSKYSRCLFIAWKVDPPSAMDYMQAAVDSAKFGPIVAKVFENLKESLGEPEINVIAHSQGNGVLLHALEHLAKKGRSPINHAFFWQAAIPQSAFNTVKTKNTKATWFCPNAHKGAERITVLHSKNDNILGPLLKAKAQPEGVKIKDVWSQKPKEELISAIICKALSLSSLYIVANWVGLPASMLLDRPLLNKVWKHWITEHPFIEDEHGNIHQARETLSEQKTLLASINKLHHFDKEHKEKLDKEIKEIYGMLKAYTDLDKSLDVGVYALKLWYYTPVVQSLLLQAKMASSVAGFVLSSIFKEYAQLFDELIIFAESAILHPKIIVEEAMGYAGPDEEDAKLAPLFKSGKINIVDGTKWVWEHSHMKIPNDKLLTNLYINEILERISFGQLKKQNT
jgi:uncharacterized protein involved in type VI secretion and phage assembly